MASRIILYQHENHLQHFYSVHVKLIIGMDIESLYTHCDHILPGSSAILKQKPITHFFFSVYDAPEIQQFKYNRWKRSMACDLYEREGEYIQDLVNTNILVHEKAVDVASKLSDVFCTFFHLESEKAN